MLDVCKYVEAPFLSLKKCVSLFYINVTKQTLIKMRFIRHFHSFYDMWHCKIKSLVENVSLWPPSFTNISWRPFFFAKKVSKFSLLGDLLKKICRFLFFPKLSPIIFVLLRKDLYIAKYLKN